MNKSKIHIGKQQGRAAEHLYLIVVCILVSILICGCSHYRDGYMTRSAFREASDFFSRGSYEASLDRYGRILEKNPAVGDRALFEMGIIYAYPGYERKDYRKAMECFQKVIRDYPESPYRPDSEMMIFHVDNSVFKDERILAQETRIAALQKAIGTLEGEMRRKEAEIAALQKKIEALEREIERRAAVIGQGPADRVLIEKKKRQLTLIAKGKALKTYRIALGGNPDGPKERQGDNKTPEGTYVIEGRNRGSRYHLSLRISYPNEKDKKRAKAMGVAPGGDIMIHGIKNGFSWVGDLHTGLDWTKGCIAVTDDEIEEIEKLVPDGTTVEIRP